MTCKGGKCWDKAVGEFNLGAGEFGKDYAFRPFAAGSADEANYNIGHPPPRILRFLKPFNYLGECRGKWLEKLEDGTGKCMNCAVYPASIGVDTVSMCNDLVGEDAIFKCKGERQWGKAGFRVAGHPPCCRRSQGVAPCL